MAVFKFDESKNFDANLAAFLDHMDSVDAELGAVFREHAPKLAGVSDANRKKARDAFNKAVAASLEQMLAKAKTGGK